MPARMLRGRVMVSVLPREARGAKPLQGRSDRRRVRHAESNSPWFRAHPWAAVAVIAVSSLAVLVAQFLDTRATDAVALLYVLPIGLAAVAFGLRGGITAASVAYVAFIGFAVVSRADHVGADGWFTRAAAMFLLGGLLGRACDQTARAARMALANQRQRLVAEERNRRYGEAIELSDSILQHVAAAKWAVEQGDQAKAAELLSLALSSGQEMVGELLPPRSIPARQLPEPAPAPAGKVP